MLENEALIESLHKLGINEENYRVLSTLPLVLVAWSDGKVQTAEQNKIFRVAGERGLLAGGGDEVLTKWLEEKPTPAYFDLGLKTLVELARRRRGTGDDMSARNLRELLDMSFDVATTAGGLFGQLWTVSAVEREALDDMASILSVDDGQSWSELFEDLK